INAEFHRLTATEDMFLAQLDAYMGNLTGVIRSRGGATCEKTGELIQILDEVRVFHIGENPKDLIKEYVDQADDCESDLAQLTIAVYVVRKEGGEFLQPPDDIGIVIE
ncbi:hypothetical protein IRJ41_021145, partial [Triplophysa rosa]